MYRFSFERFYFYQESCHNTILSLSLNYYYYRVLGRKGSGNVSGIIAGIDYVAANCGPNDVANMSLGGPFYAPENTAVINAAKSCPFVVSAGNAGKNAANYSPASAGYDLNVYTISASDTGDSMPYWSNFGSVVDYAAPGVSINSTFKGGGYRTLSGTSMSAPHVAGILLNGQISTDGNVKNDPDGNQDPIAVCP